MSTEIEIVCGIVLLVLGLSYLVNARFWAGSFKRWLWLGGAEKFALFLLLLICGLLMVLGHNLWTADWRVLVTVVGWMALIKSLVFFIFPGVLDLYAGWAEDTLVKFVRVGGAVWTLVGLAVTYLSLQAA